jgi:hypothetical protein
MGCTVILYNVIAAEGFDVGGAVGDPGVYVGDKVGTIVGDGDGYRGVSSITPETVVFTPSYAKISTTLIVNTCFVVTRIVTNREPAGIVTLVGMRMLLSSVNRYTKKPRPLAGPVK